MIVIIFPALAYRGCTSYGPLCWNPELPKIALKPQEKVRIELCVLRLLPRILSFRFLPSGPFCWNFRATGDSLKASRGGQNIALRASTSARDSVIPFSDHRAPSADITELPEIPFVQPGLSHNIALHASPSTFCLPGRFSFNFIFPSSFRCKVAFVRNRVRLFFFLLIW